MTMTRTMIQALAASRRTYEQGCHIYQMGYVKLQSTKSFWKDEIKVTATAYEEKETGKQVNLTIRGGKIVSSRCSCMHPESRSGHLCMHAVAVALCWLEQMENRNAESEAYVLPMIEAYGQLRQQEVLADYVKNSSKEPDPVHLLPLLSIQDQRLVMELKIGRSRYYKVRDLSALVQAFRTGGRYLYGKYLDFYHVPQAFDPESLRLMQVLSQIYSRIQEKTPAVHGSKNLSACSADGSQLIPGKEDLDRLFESFSDPLVETDESLSVNGYLKLHRKDPDLSLLLRYRNEKRPKLGVNLILQHKLRLFFGLSHLYLIEGENLWISSPGYRQGMQPFLENVLKEGGEQPAHIRISDSDMPGFCANVLPVLKRYAGVDVTKVDIGQYQSRMLQTEFYFDRIGEAEITLKILHVYGTHSFNPVSGENPGLSWRDRAQEKRVALTAARYFDHRYQDRGLLTTCGDEETAIRLAADGFSDFQALGQVHLSDSLKQMKIRRPSQMQFHIQALGGWLELSVDLEGVNPKELAQILNQYQEKKTCYRLKDGSYVLLPKNRLGVLPEMMEGLQVSSREIAGSVTGISPSRALYLKKIMESYQISYTHDSYFERLTDCLEKKQTDSEPVPPSLQSVLREYQVKGYQWLAMLEHMGFGGILADDMGLGKTVQMIALFQRIYREIGEEKRPSLIVCPSSLLYNWQHEIARFAPELTCVVLAGSSRERKQMVKEGPQAMLWITSYDLLRRDIDLYSRYEFRLQVLDEAQYIKNQGTQNARAVKKVRAVSRFALTGTPVENRLAELWSIFDYLMPGFLYSYSRFRTAFELPLVKDQDERVVTRLHNMIAPFILRRLKKEVLTELPEKCDTVLYPTMEGEQKKLYMACALRLKKNLEHETDESFRRNRTSVLAELTRLRQICCAPSLIYEGFHADNAKLEALMELIHSCLEGEHRILIFSQFARMLDLIRKRLQQEAIPCFLLTGQTGKQERQHLVERFGEGEVPVFLISLKAGGTGLNLTRADTVIHYDPWWNLAAQNQATDRVYRIGQTRQVNVYRLIAAGTIEENILRLQEAKQNLVDQVLAGRQISLAEMTREQLLELL